MQKQNICEGRISPISMRWVAVLAAALAIFSSNLPAADIAIGRYEGGTTSPTLVIGDVILSDLSAGPTVAATFTATAAGGNPGLAFEAGDWTVADVPDPDSAFLFTVGSATQHLTFTKINVDVRPQGAGPQEVAILYRFTGTATPEIFGTALDTPAKTSIEIDPFTPWAELEFSGSLTVPAGSTVTFFISGYDAKTNNKSMQVDNVTLIGTIPEPQVAALAVLALSTLFLKERHAVRNSLNAQLKRLKDRS